MADDPAVSVGELGRRIEVVHQDLKEDIRDLGARLDSKVAAEVFQLRVDALTDRLQAVETKREADAQRQDNRRWMVYISLLAAALSFLSTLYFASKGSP